MSNDNILLSNHLFNLPISVGVFYASVFKSLPEQKIILSSANKCNLYKAKISVRWPSKTL